MTTVILWVHFYQLCAINHLTRIFEFKFAKFLLNFTQPDFILLIVLFNFILILFIFSLPQFPNYTGLLKLNISVYFEPEYYLYYQLVL